MTKSLQGACDEARADLLWRGAEEAMRVAAWRAHVAEARPDLCAHDRERVALAYYAAEERGRCLLEALIDFEEGVAGELLGPAPW